MTDGSSLWGSVAQRYHKQTELRTSDVQGRFQVAFRGATLVITKSTGVERIVDFDEFRAAWRTIAAGASDETLRRVTGSGPYLRAVRVDLMASGVDPQVETSVVNPVDLSSGEAVLLANADLAAPVGTTDTHERDPNGNGLRDGASYAQPQDRTALLESMLEAERAVQDEILRENARLIASIEVLDERLSHETARAIQLELAATQSGARNRVNGGRSIGTRTNPTTELLAVAETIIASTKAPPELRKAAQVAVDLARRDPASAATKARVVIDLLVRREWSRVFGQAGGSTRKSFNDYARELEGQKSVDGARLAVKRTLHRVANPGAHELRMSPREAALIVLVLISVLDTEPN